MDFQGQTLLHLATMHSNLHAVCALLAQGADCSIQDAYGVTAFDRAAMMFIKYTKSPGRYARPNSGPCSAGWRWSPELVGLQSVAGLLIKSQTAVQRGRWRSQFQFFYGYAECYFRRARRLCE